LLDGIPFNQDISKLVLMDHPNNLQQREVSFYGIGTEGRVIKAAATNCGHSSILVVETYALRDGVQLAVQTEYNEITIEGDNLIAIQALQGTI